MGWPSGIPPWQEADLKALAASGSLSGVNPLVLAGIDQEESGFEIAGAGFNSAGYGGFYGLGPSTYPGNNSETKASLLDPSENSFKHQSITAAAAFNSYMQQAVSEGYTGSQVTDRAETIYQQGGSYQGIEPGGGVSVVDQALGTAPNTGGTTTTGSGATGSADTGSAGSSSANAQKLQGVAGVLQEINDLMNPAPVGAIASLTSTAGALAIVEEAASRALFSIAFGVVAFMGLKQLIGGGSGTTIIELAQQGTKNDLAQQRVDAHRAATEARSNAESERTARAAAANASREKVASTAKTYNRTGGYTNTSTVTHRTTGKAKGAAKAETGGAAKLATEALEIA